MKIIKILFLGIVLVLVNIAYLAAQELPDTISYSLSSADPGGVMEISLNVKFHSTNAGGVVAIIQGLPTHLIATDQGVDVTGGAATAPTAAGTWWYEWSDGYGTALKTAASLAAEITFSPGDPTAEDSSSVFGLVLLGPNVDNLKILPAQFGGFDSTAAADGTVLTVWINVPEDLAEGTYDVVFADGGASIGSFSPAGLLEGIPVAIVNNLTVANIPDFNSMEMVASLSAASGGTAAVSVMIGNKDAVGSGSFMVGYSGDVLTLNSVTAGTRAGGASFTYTVADSSATALAAMGKIATVTFSGGNLAPGGLGELCKLNFGVASVGAGVTASVMLGSVTMKDPSNADLTVQQPTSASTALSFSYGDTLSLADQIGEGTAMIMDGQLYVPVMLKNASAVSGVRFYISEPTGMEDILSLSSVITDNFRAVGSIVATADSGSYIQVIAYAPTAGLSIAAGSGTLLEIVYDINASAFTVPAPGGTTVDLALGLSGVELTGSDGSSLGVEAIGGTSSLDFRVPNAGEGVGPGASLPKAFSLQQNHPNPFNPSTTINYQIPENVGSVQFMLNVYDLRGKLVRILDRGFKGAGTYSVFWDGTDSSGRQVSSGVYFYRFISSEYNATRKMIMLK